MLLCQLDNGHLIDKGIHPRLKLLDIIGVLQIVEHTLAVREGAAIFLTAPCG